MKKLVCIVVAVAFVLSLGGFAVAGDKAKDKAKPEVKKQDGEKKPKAAKPKKTPEDRFKALDENGDGKISEAEFVGKREGDKADKAKKAFAKKDKDSDGNLTMEEFAPAKKPKQKKADKPAKKQQPKQDKQAQ